MNAQTQLKNIRITKSKQGLWMHVKASSNKRAGLNLLSLKDYVGGNVFVDWAENQFKNKKATQDNLSKLKAISRHMAKSLYHILQCNESSKRCECEDHKVLRDFSKFIKIDLDKL